MKAEQMVGEMVEKMAGLKADSTVGKTVAEKVDMKAA